jgi:CheY-like chemotaxis protein
MAQYRCARSSLVSTLAVLAFLPGNGISRLKQRGAQVGIALCERGYYLTHTANQTHGADEAAATLILEPLMQRGQIERRAHAGSTAMTEIVAPSVTRLVSGATDKHAREIRIAVVDPYPIFGIGVVQAIARSEGLLLVAEGATAGDAQRAVQEADPDILLIDISVAEDAIESLLRAAKSSANCELVVLTALDDVASVSKALATGVKGYILRASLDRSSLAPSRPFTLGCLS